MARYQYAGTPRDYPTLGFRATNGDVAELTAAPDARWTLVDSGTPTTLPPATVPTGPNIPTGYVLTWDGDEYLPAAPAAGGVTPEQLAALAGTYALKSEVVKAADLAALTAQVLPNSWKSTTPSSPDLKTLVGGITSYPTTVVPGAAQNATSTIPAGERKVRVFSAFQVTGSGTATMQFRQFTSGGSQIGSSTLFTITAPTETDYADVYEFTVDATCAFLNLEYFAGTGTTIVVNEFSVWQVPTADAYCRIYNNGPFAAGGSLNIDMPLRPTVGTAKRVRQTFGPNEDVLVGPYGEAVNQLESGYVGFQGRGG